MSRSNRRGFSLGEILVTVAIMAVIAAVVVPAIGSQLNKGETTRITSDLTNIRAAAEQFLADVRRYPASLGQLTLKPTTALSGMTGGVYSAQQVARWKGPYLTKDSAAAAITGYGSTMTLAFSAFPAGPAQQYVTIDVPGLTAAEAAEVDAAMDDGDVATGQIRYVATVLKYLSLPIQ